MKVLVDADLLVYRIAAAFQDVIQWSPEVRTVNINRTGAVNKLCAMLDQIYEDCRADSLCLYFTGSEVFRKDILGSYKADRPPKPDLWGYLKGSLEGSRWDHTERLTVSEVLNLEADDLMGLHSDETPCIIASYDKDLQQIAGKHYNWLTQSFTYIDEDQGDYWFWTQTLTGDSTDNYKGCPGIGPVKAGRLLEDVEDEALAWEIIVGAFEAKRLTQSDALVQARLARILRPGEYDWKENKVRLWEPPKGET